MRGARSNNIHLQQAPSAPGSWLLKPFSNKRNQGFLEKSDSGPGQVTEEKTGEPESKKVLKKRHGGMSKGHGSHVERIPMTKGGTI